MAITTMGSEAGAFTLSSPHGAIFLFMATAASSTYPSWLAREERLSEREPTGLAAWIGEEAVVVTDVSALGCRIRMSVPANVGAFLTLSLGEVSVTGWAAWQRGNELGMDFAKPLDAETLAAFTGPTP